MATKKKAQTAKKPQTAVHTDGGTFTTSLLTGGTFTGSLSGAWSLIAAGGTVVLAMHPGTQGHIQPGEERPMKVQLAKTRVKGKSGLKLTLLG